MVYNSQRKRVTFIIILLIVLIVFEIGFLFNNKISLINAKQLPLTDYADSIYKSCHSKKFSAVCYDNEIPKLMDPPINLSMEDAFQVTKIIQEKDPEYIYCHVLGHNLSYKETGKDVSKWQDVITRCPTTFCNNGCLHGALLRRFNSGVLTDDQINTLKPEIKDVCEPRGSWNPVESEKTMCYHGVGHLNMFITNANIAKALALCQYLGIRSDGRDYTLSCTQGVFMQIFQPLEPEDFALIKGSTPTLAKLNAFCSKYQGLAFNVCHTEAWPLFNEQLFTSQGIMNYCAYATTNLESRRCISIAMSMLTVKIIIHQNDYNKLATLCNGLPQKLSKYCYSNAALRLIRIDPRLADKAVMVCQKAAEFSQGDECFTELTDESTFSFHKGSQEALEYCHQLPSQWSVLCQSKST